MTTVGVLLETAGRERRVALTPDGAARLRKQDVEVLVEPGAGRRAWFEDVDYSAAGCEVVPRPRVYAESDILVCLHPPEDIASSAPASCWSACSARSEIPVWPSAWPPPG